MEGNAEVNTILPRLSGKVTKIPEADTTFTKEGYFADAKATGDELKKKVNSADIVDNLTTEATDKPLSAKMGKQLKQQIDDVDSHFAENVQYDNTASKLTAKNVQVAIDVLKTFLDGLQNTATTLQQSITNLSKFDYYEDITIKGTLYGKGYYIEKNDMVIIHIVTSTTSDIATGEVFAELSNLSKNMVKIDNVGILDTNGNGYGFKFENKNIIAQSNITQGTKLTFDVCIKLA